MNSDIRTLRQSVPQKIIIKLVPASMQPHALKTYLRIAQRRRRFEHLLKHHKRKKQSERATSTFAEDADEMWSAKTVSIFTRPPFSPNLKNISSSTIKPNRVHFLMGHRIGVQIKTVHEKTHNEDIVRPSQVCETSSTC